MKTTTLVIALIGINFCIQAQNTFPATGKVGIGTTSPTQNLSIQATRPRVVLTDNAGDAGIIEFHESTNQIRLQKWDSFGAAFNKTMMALDGDNGYVGIGTSSPTQNLSIQATRPRVVLTDNAGDAGVIEFHESTNQIRFQKWDSFGATFNQTMMALDGDSGNIGIGTSDPKNKLSVNGTVWAKEVNVSLTDAADWVFEDDYKLRTLEEVEGYIEEHQHLPEIPSAEEFRQNDLNVAEMSNKLLQKVEELTLYLIEQNKELKSQKERNQTQLSRIEKLEEQLGDLKKPRH